jgi:HK97 family phage prohead protease
VTTDIQYKAGNAGQINVDQAEGIVECFVAGIGNKDSVGDVVISGAFSKSLMRRKPRVVWGHNWNEPIGKVLEMYEVPASDPRLPGKMKAAGIGGLYARVQFNLHSEKGKEAFANVAFFGVEQEWSIGYKTLDAVYDQNLKANILKEVELYEVSPVLHGANQLTGTISVKSEEKNHMQGIDLRRTAIIPGSPSGYGREEDAQDRDLFAEGVASSAQDSRKEKLLSELMKRTGSMIRIIKATDNMVLFERITSDGQKSHFRVGYHTPDGGTTFMFSRPERVIQQTMYVPATDMNPAGTKVSVTEQAYSSDQEEEEGYDDGQESGMLDDGTDEKAIWDNILGGVFKRAKKRRKSDDIELETLDSQLDYDLDYKAGRVLSSRNLAKLRSAVESLQQVLSSADKEIQEKTEEHLIAVETKDAFHVKQAIDPILDYYRVESYVAEDGIVITSGLPEGFTDAINTAFKSLGGSIGGGGPGKARRAGRVLTGRFDPDAVDADGDKLVQEGTAFERPGAPRKPKIASGAQGRPGMVLRDDKGQVDTAPAKEMLKRVQEDRFKRLRELGFSEDEIQALHSPSSGRGMPSRTVGSATDTGKSFFEIKPKNWDSLDPYEKEEMLATELKPENSGLNQEVWVAQMQRVFDEQVALEERKEKEKRRSSMPKTPRAEREAPQSEEKPGKAVKRLSRELPKGEQEAREMRVSDIESLQNAISYIEKLNERNSRGNKKDHAKLIDALSMSLEDDLTLDGINEMRDAIEKHTATMDTRNMTPADRNVQRGVDVLDGRLAALDAFYAKDKFIDRGSRGELDITDASRLASGADPEVDEVDPLAISGSLVRGESNAPKPPSDGFDSTRKLAQSYLASSRRKKMGRGFSSARDSGSEKAGRTQINAEATWFKQIEDSLPKEITEAQKAGDKQTADSLSMLQTIMKRQESGKTGAKRTNAGVLLTTQEETDKILEAVMAVVDRQVETGGSRAEIFAQLMDKMAQAAMGTFIDKTTDPVSSRNKN